MNPSDPETPEAPACAPLVRYRVWDLTTRFIHWALVLLVLLQFGTAEWGWLSMQWHFYFGYAILVLVGVRVLWGFVGSDSSRFSQFLRGPRGIAAYLRGTLWTKFGHPVGHNPLGALSVLVLLALLLIQGISGLFASDAITVFGPLSGRVSDATVRLMTRIHDINQNILLAFIALHVAAVLLHALVRREDNLIVAMITGCKRLRRDPGLRFVGIGGALLLAVALAFLLWAMVRWGQAVAAY
ncbi:MAG: cytochrome b/b6 domain-containing protein [Pseudomonadota bacterium]|nr:cytochrome b/b6 domain-containing protein [Pseudomonadota bacterium]